MPKFVLCLLFGLIFLSGCSIYQRWEEDQRIQLAERAQHDAVIVHADGQYSGAFGTGVIKTRREGNTYRHYILTADHVVRGQNLKYYIETMSGKTYRARIIMSDSTADLALLKVVDHSINELNRSANFVSPDYQYRVGELIYHVGHWSPGRTAYKFSFDSGYLSYVDRQNYYANFRDWMQTTAISFSGSSGGGVYNVNGEWVGMILMGPRGIGSIGMFSPIKRVHDTLEKYGYGWVVE